jgi:hypothetical protein
VNLFFYNLHFNTVSFHIFSIQAIRHKLSFFRPTIFFVYEIKTRRKKKVTFASKAKIVQKHRFCQKTYILNIHILNILFAKACANLITVTRIFSPLDQWGLLLY